MPKQLGIYFRFVRINLEAFIWLMALLLLAFMDPNNTQSSLCLIHHIGIDQCPGCGLGHSISAAFHGQIAESFNRHPLGMAAIVLLIIRIITVFYQSFKYQSPKNHPYGKNL
ncbi:MAG: DUF2752 domain-containing protein [Bacteroidales bacterium]|nr:DUF2752 domain-containing protein [Bacteroidales bacterium]